MIGEVRLLVLAALAALGSAGIAPLDIANIPAQFEPYSQVDQSDCLSTDGVPVSLTIENAGEDNDRLLAASTLIASCVMIDDTRLIRGRPHRVRMPDGLVIAARATITLEPGTGHLTLFGLRADLVQGETFPLTLAFERSGPVTIVARVRRKVDAAGAAPLPTVSAGELTVALASAPPAPAVTPAS